jgi:hypothetical protein
MLLNYSSEEAAERGIYLVREDKISCYTCWIYVVFNWGPETAENA